MRTHSPLTAPRPHATLVLLICCISLFMNYLDLTVLNVALPAIQRSLHADEAALQWIVDSFLLVLTCLLVLVGSLADRFGRRRFLIAGLLIFSVGSLGCTFAQSPAQLVGARAIAGIGGSMLVPTTLSIVRTTFSDRRELARAIGVWSGVYGIACACGPIVGGALVDSAGWRTIFLVNVPIGVAGAVAARRYITESVADKVRSIDLAGQVLVVLLLGILVSTIIEAPARGWSAPVTLGGFGASAFLVAVFLFVETRREEPMFELRFFRSAAFAGANILAAITFVLMTGFLFVNTIYLQQVRGYSALTAGLFTLPLMLALATCAPLSGRYLSRHGPRHAMTITPAIAAVSLTMLLFVRPDTPGLYLCIAYALLGVALGTVNPTLTHTGVASIPARQAGVASAITSTSRQVGSSLGVAVLGSVVATALHGLLTTMLATHAVPTTVAHRALGDGIEALRGAYGSSTDVVNTLAQQAYTSALAVAWWIGIALCILWFAVARRTTTPESLERSRADGEPITIST